MSIKEYENLSEGVSRARILNADDLYSADGILSLFEAYRSRSVILNNRFADDVWTLTNEASDVRLALSFAESAFVASAWLGCGADEYRDCAKAYVILHLGALQLATLRQLVRLFNRIGGMGAEEASAIVRDAHRVTGGFCDALSFESGDVGECLKTISGDGRIGDCESCVHFWSDNQGVRLRFHDSGTAKKLVDMDSQHLIRMIDLARRGMGCQEDIGAAILRIQHSCHRLSGSLAEKYMNGEAK